MIDWILGVVGLVVFVWIALTGPWLRRSNQRAMSGAKRAVMIFAAGAALYLLLACVSDFTARRMVVYREAVQVASQSKVFGDEVGEPFTMSWPIVLRAGISDQGNDEAFRATAKGPRGKGALVAVGMKGSAGWTLTRLDLVKSPENSVSLLSSCR
jgi:hypothetical protein